MVTKGGTGEALVFDGTNRFEKQLELPFHRQLKDKDEKQMNLSLFKKRKSCSVMLR